MNVVDIKNIDGLKPPSSPKVQIFVGSHPATPPPEPKKKKRKRWPFVLIAIFFVLLSITGVIFGYGKKLASQSFVGESMGWIASAKDLLLGGLGQAPLEGEESGWVNVLLLGIGGSGHDGPYLSDTIILTQIKINDGQAVLSSIPRDYQVKIDRVGYRKINAAFSEGFTKNKDWNEAGAFAREAVESVSGLSIPYFAVIDFAGFEKAIEQVGGVTVDIPVTFTDYQYPDGKGGYMPPQTFKAGKETMNGDRALIYARSRHASGGQGSDFARSQRQQQVIDALRTKVVELNLVADSGTITKLLKTFAENFHTNLTPGQILRLAKIAQEQNFQTVSSNLNPETGLICPYITPETQAYVLVPCPGKTIADLHEFFKNALSFGLVGKEKAVVWIATNTPNSQAYKRVAQYLEQAGLTVWSLNYTDVEPEQSVVYAVNDKPATKQFLVDALDARTVNLAPPNIKIDATRSDMVVILGVRLPEKFTTPLKPVNQPTIERTNTPSTLEGNRAEMEKTPEADKLDAPTPAQP